jgi:hypothetical protein
VRSFIASQPVIAAPSARARMVVDADTFHADPATSSARLFQDFKAGR